MASAPKYPMIPNPTLKRLKMFVMRSKVTLEDAGSALISIGVAGPNADRVMDAAGLLVPSVILATVSGAARGLGLA